MCGIVVIYGYGGGAPVQAEELRRACDFMRLRGPDGEGQWRSDDGTIGLGHRRLAIIDPSPSGAQPMTTADGRLTITFNGEIYNYQALRDELEQQGCQFRSTSDTEVLLHLFARDGEAMLGRLRGMYTFAIWDTEQQRCFLARDPFGIKPLYYADDGQSFRAASQVKALLDGGRVSQSPSAAGQVGFYLWGYVPEPYTLYDQIRALPAGCFMWVDPNGSQEPQRFYSVSEVYRDAEAQVQFRSEQEQHERVSEALSDSVRHHLVSDVPVGVFLSAGLDSTSIAALASECHGVGLKTFTLGFDAFRDGDIDEVPLASALAKDLGADHAVSWVTREDFSRELPALLRAMDQPSIDGVNTYFVARAASQGGLKVALSGLGGDELFGGYPSFRQIPKLVSALSWLSAVPALGRGFRWVSAKWLHHMTSPKYAGLFEFGTNFADAYLLRRGLFMPWELTDLLDPDVVRAGWQDLQTQANLKTTVNGLTSRHLRIAALETTWYMKNQLLQDTDWASMAHSLEVRVPLVDVELTASLAPLLASDRGPTKQCLVHAPHPPLPKAIADRKKTGFVAPVRDWLAGGGIEGDQTYSGARGLRDWARFVFAAATDNQHPTQSVRSSIPQERANCV